MDISQYQKDRASELKRFRKEYSDLKSTYSQLLTQAVYETDTVKQAGLVKQILSTNSGLAQHVREFVQSSKGKFDPALISELTADIIRYQKEFDAIQSASDKSAALQNILNKEKIQLTELHSQFNIWLGVLLGGIVIILVLIFKTSLTQLSQAAESLMSSTSMTDSGDWSDPSLSGETLYRIAPV
jgi:hypothetical protein